MTRPQTTAPSPRPTAAELADLRSRCVQGRVGLTPAGAEKLLAEIDALRAELERAAK